MKPFLKPITFDSAQSTHRGQKAYPSRLKTRSLLGMMAAITLVTGVGVTRLLGLRSAHATATRVYTSEGLGGYIDLPAGKTAAGIPTSPRKSDLSAPAGTAYPLPGRRVDDPRSESRAPLGSGAVQQR